MIILGFIFLNVIKKKIIACAWFILSHLLFDILFDDDDNNNNLLS